MLRPRIADGSVCGGAIGVRNRRSEPESWGDFFFSGENWRRFLSKVWRGRSQRTQRQRTSS